MVEANVFTLPGLEQDGSLVSVLVRYRPEHAEDEVAATAVEAPRTALSLVFLHSIASHKETWLPTVEELFAIQRTTRTNAFAVVEAWSMDLPTHGHAAVINEKALVAYGHKITGWHVARALLAFLGSGLVAPGAKVVAVGHSASAAIVVEATVALPAPTAGLPFSSLILVESPALTDPLLQRAKEEGWPLLRAVDIAKTRKDVWPSRADARAWLAKRWPWARWDARVLDLYVGHAMRDLPTASYPDLKEGVTLSVTRENEGAGYDGYDDGRAALRRLETLCAEVPVHCVFGGQNDMVPLEAQEAFLDEKTGRRMRSIVRVAGSGHLVVQENPGALARAIWGVLHEDYAAPVVVAAKL